MEMYHRFAEAATFEEVDQVYEEIRDRFGHPPPEALCLGEVMAWRVYGRGLQATAVELDGRRLSARLGPNTPLPGTVATGLAAATGGRYRLMGSDRVATTLSDEANPYARLKEGTQVLADLMTHLPT